jgi:hypothetical protein
MWHKDVPNWKSITLATASGLNKGWMFSLREYPALFDYLRHHQRPSRVICQPVIDDLPLVRFKEYYEPLMPP